MVQQLQSERPIPTLDDVARDAGVSTATVSRCLNVPERVAKSTLERVMTAVNDLGYTPNFAARAMAAKRTFTIGAIIPTMENAIFARGLQAFQEELHALGYTLLVSSTNYQPDTEEEQIRTLVSRGADGLLLIGYARDPALYDHLERHNVPALVAWAFSKDHPMPTVGFNNRAWMCRLGEEVLAKGHRRIAVISGLTNGNDRATDRLQGIKDAVAQHGMDADALDIVECAYDIEDAGKALDQLIAADPRPTAIMCANDVLAVGALRRAQKLGLNVPDDISITGFDDIELARIVTPPLTTVHVPHREMGRAAARELVAMVEKESTGHSQELQSFLKLRGSLGQVPG